MSMVMQWAKTALFSSLAGIKNGTLTLECPDYTYRFGDDDELDAQLTVRNERFFLRALTGNDTSRWRGVNSRIAIGPNS